MKKISLSVLTLALFAGCATSNKNFKYDMSYTPIDFIGDKNEGRVPAQSGGSMLVKFVETLGEGGSEKTLEWVNSSGRKQLGLTKNVSRLDDLSSAQRIKVMEEFARTGSVLAKMFSMTDDISKSAYSFMKQSNSYVTKLKLNNNLKGIAGTELPRTGFTVATDLAILKTKQVAPVVGKEIEGFAKSLNIASKERPALKAFGPDLVLSDVAFVEATGGEMRLLNNKLCNGGTVEFSESIMPTVAEFTTKAADDAKMLAHQGEKLDDVAAAGLVVRSHKKVVPGASCLRSFQSVRALASEPSGCPLLSKKIANGLVKIAGNLDDFCR
jgi:hypothetical protein